jgi:hypothetical protein
MFALILHFLRFWFQFTQKKRHWLKPMVFLRKKPSGLNHGLNQTTWYRVHQIPRLTKLGTFDYQKALITHGLSNNIF